MNINDIQLKDAGNWSLYYKLLVTLFVCSFLVAGFYFYVIQEQSSDLKKLQAKELALKVEFENKASLASNLVAYRDQMDEVIITLKGLVNRLPSKKELAGLLDDIGAIGNQNGLQFQSLNWGVKKQLTLAEEMPMSIKVLGTYQQLGKFTADIASLPRIVILDNLHLTRYDKQVLLLDIVAKTYRYQGGE